MLSPALLYSVVLPYTDEPKSSSLLKSTTELCSMTFSKAITPAKGYTYRVVCEHYAEKKRLLILKSKEAEQKLKESCSNFDEEKYLFD